MMRVAWVALLVALISVTTQVKAQVCYSSPPYNATLVGKQYVEKNACGITTMSRWVRVEWNTIRYFPFFKYKLWGHKSFLACPESYVLHFRRGNNRHPFIRHFLPRKIRGLSSGRQLYDSRCRKLQKSVNYSVWGPSRPKFVAAMKLMVNDMQSIRDFKCSPNVLKYFKDLKNPENERLDVIINFLLSISYSYFFCIQ